MPRRPKFRGSVAGAGGRSPGTTDQSAEGSGLARPSASARWGPGRRTCAQPGCDRDFRENGSQRFCANRRCKDEQHKNPEYRLYIEERLLREAVTMRRCSQDYYRKNKARWVIYRRQVEKLAFERKRQLEAFALERQVADSELIDERF